METTFYLKNDIAEIDRLTQAVQKFGKENHLSRDNIHEATLALEEIVSNIVFYAFNQINSDHKIKIRMEIRDRLLLLEVEDDGKPFNPVENPVPDIDKPLEEREIGGLGIYIARKLVDELEYQRENDKNLLTMKIYLSG